jgi:uncharacterized protein YutE (UPF0331/DUF86 family)
MTVDSIRVRERLGVIADAERRLGEFSELPADEFLADFRNTESAKYLLIVATEAAIDICNHMAARLGGRSPEGYADCFTVLAELGIIGDELAGHLKLMARFRNFLVHLYWQVDNRKIYEIIQHNLADLDAFRSQVAHYLEG